MGSVHRTCNNCGAKWELTYAAIASSGGYCIACGSKLFVPDDIVDEPPYRSQDRVPTDLERIEALEQRLEEQDRREARRRARMRKAWSWIWLLALLLFCVCCVVVVFYWFYAKRG